MYLSINLVVLLCAVVAAAMYYILGGGDVSYLDALKGAPGDTSATAALKKLNHRETTPTQTDGATNNNRDEAVEGQEQSFGYTDESMFFDPPAATSNNEEQHRQGGDINTGEMMRGANDWSSKNKDFF
jgi:hypothetical protein